jgi:hypothetical protein
MEVKLIEDFYVFNCPQCNEEIIVFKDELNVKYLDMLYIKTIINKSILIYLKESVMN